MKCRHCRAPLEHVAGRSRSPAAVERLSVARSARARRRCMRRSRPTCATAAGSYSCRHYHRADELFTPDYAYFSSVSTSWVEHARRYVAAMIERFGLGADEPRRRDRLQRRLSAAVRAGSRHSLPRHRADRLDGRRGARQGHRDARGVLRRRNSAASSPPTRRPADLIAANNVLAHVPDINDFVAGFRELLAPEGVATFEFPHLMQLIDGSQFDTIYHEHYSYLSLHAVPTHLRQPGPARVRRRGAADPRRLAARLRLPARRGARGDAARVAALLARERAAGCHRTGLLRRSAAPGRAGEARSAGVPARAEARQAAPSPPMARRPRATRCSTIAGVRPDLLAVRLRRRALQAGPLPARQPHPDPAAAALAEQRPDFVLILPWNLKDEIAAAHGYVTGWGGRFVTAVPELEFMDARS